MRRAPGIENLAVRAALWDMADEYNRAHVDPIFGSATYDETTSVSLSEPYEKLSIDIPKPGALVLCSLVADYSVVTVVGTPAFAQFAMLWDDDPTWEDVTRHVVTVVPPVGKPVPACSSRLRTRRVRPGRREVTIYSSHADFSAFNLYYQYRIEFFIPAQKGAPAF